jgi:hypothetical protein
MATIGEFLGRFDWMIVVWVCLWAGLVAFTIGLSFLLWTRWGYYHLTGKCVLFSLLAHMTIGLFFASAEVVEDVVVALNAPTEEPAMTIDRVRISTSPDDGMESTVDGRNEDSSAPGVWDRVTGRAPIESQSLTREGPEGIESVAPQRTTSAETQLPRQSPRPSVAAAAAKTNDPSLDYPANEAVERAEMSAAPESGAATASESKSEVLPPSATSRSAPALGSSPLNRVRVDDGGEGGSSESGASRVAPRIPTGGNANVPNTTSRPVVSPLRTGAPGSDLVGGPSGGPAATPEAIKGDGPGRGSGTGSGAGGGGTVEPSTSVRVGIPTGTQEGTGALTRGSGTGSGDSPALPTAKIASSGKGGTGTSGTGPGSPVGTPEATAIRSSNGGGTAGTTDRPGIRIGTPEIYRERMNPNRSEQAVKRGGSKASEEAVERALEWLAAHQESDGHWDVDNFPQHCPAGNVCSGTGSQNRDDCAVTGLVLLAFLGAGNTHWDGKYSTNVRNGLNWLILQQKPTGDLRGTGRMYSHGIASLALSEAFGMSGDTKLNDPVQRAVDFIVKAQNQSTGGWRYLPGQYGDTSVFGWQLMALKSASLAGIQVPDATWQKARGWLHLVGSGKHRGLAAYQPTEAATPPMTAEGLVCRVFLGESIESPTLVEAADYLMQYKPQWTRLNMYYWYYGTLACFQMGGEYWPKWNTSVRDVLISHQIREGHATGSWDPNASLDPWGKEGGRVYSTALAALCLEVYYRFLPVQSLTSEESPAKGLPAQRLPKDAETEPTPRSP